MRKALIGMILAATVMTPVAAEAQNWRNRGDRGVEQSSERGETRAARSEQRSQQREARQVQQQQVQQQQQAQVVQRERGSRGGNDGNRGNWRGNRGGGDANTATSYRSGNDGTRTDRYRGDRTNQTSIYPQAWQGDPNDPRLRHYQRLERQNQNNYSRTGDRRDYRRGDRRGDWNGGWRNDSRYNWQRYRYSNRNAFHIGNYYSPYRNYRYNRFWIGLFLDSAFYDQRYWIGDPWQYRLPPAPYGTQWVRYYDDVLLVDIYTGEVVDVIYDFFW